MRAAVVHRYGPPEAVTIEDRPAPEPGRRDVLVRVEAAAVTAGDARLRAGTAPTGFRTLMRLAMGVRGPRVQFLGNSFAGVVEQVGGDVAGFSPGDRVAGMTGARMGAHAELVLARPASITPLPEPVASADAAAVLFGGTTALHFLRDRVAVQPAESVLINGAAGAVGTSAVQIARLLGARVTAVTSAPNADLVRRLGAAEVVDYHQTPVTELAEKFDVVLDAVGNISRRTGLAMLAPGGRLALVVATLTETIGARGAVHAGVAPERADDIAHLLGLLERGELAPVVSVTAGLDTIVAAYRQIDTGHKVGNLVVTQKVSATG